MNNIDIELSKVIDAAVQSSIDIGQVASLKDLYKEKKNSLNLSDRQIQKILGMDSKTINPILTSFPQLFYPLMTRQFFCDFHEKSEDFCVS